MTHVHPGRARRPRRHYRRNLACGALGASLVGSLVIIAYFVVLIARFAAGTTTPNRLPITVSPADHGLTQYEDVAFTTSDGIALAGWFIPGPGRAGIVLAHGYGGNRSELLPEARILHTAGYNVLLFDFRGHGTSAAATVTVGWHEQRDLRAALDYLSARPEVDPDRLGAVGFSMGAAVLAHVAATDERLQAVVLEASFPTLDAVVEHQAGAFGPVSEIPARWAIRRAGMDVDAVRPVEVVCAISPRPLLVIYGDADTVIPPGTVAQMAEAICPPAELWIIAGARHENFVQVASEQYPTRLVGFFDAHLGPE